MNVVARTLGRQGCAFLAAVALVAIAGSIPLGAQKAASPAAAQKLDEEYTRLIKEYTADPRISTELVDHMPVSATVPSPLKFFGRIPGTPDELTYSKDIYRYFDALDAASDRVKVFRIGKTEEGRDMIQVVVADEATIKSLDKWKAMTAKLTDTRTLDDATARQLIATAKPI